MMVREGACAGNLTTNPLRRDIEEAAAICGVDFILNVVLDEHKQILRAVAGDVTAAHRAGCAFLDTLYQKEIEARADIVLVSQGGAPKDLNLYQTQKALDNAKHAVRDGGIVILVGSCREGLGEATFEEWLTQARQPHDLIDRIRLGYVIDLFDFRLINFAVFNVADAFITVGGVMIAIYLLFIDGRLSGKEKTDGNAPDGGR